MALIQLEHIYFSYDGNSSPVLQDVSLLLESEQRIGLIGPSGSGKSSLLKLIVGLLTPQFGTISVLGKKCDAHEDYLSVRRQVGLLFQDADDQLFCPTVLEDVIFGPLNLGKTGEEAEIIARTILSELGLAGFESRVTYRLSGGEKRLIALAGVLAMSPRVLLLDEPFTGLDDAAVERLLNVLEELSHEMIVVSHQKDFLRRICPVILDIRDLKGKSE